MNVSPVQSDLVARLRLRPEAPPPQKGLTELLALVHVEVESRDSVQQFRPRIFESLREGEAVPAIVARAALVQTRALVPRRDAQVSVSLRIAGESALRESWLRSNE